MSKQGHGGTARLALGGGMQRLWNTDTHVLRLHGTEFFRMTHISRSSGKTSAYFNQLGGGGKDEEKVQTGSGSGKWGMRGPGVRGGAEFPSTGTLGRLNTEPQTGVRRLDHRRAGLVFSVSAPLPPLAPHFSLLGICRRAFAVVLHIAKWTSLVAAATASCKANGKGSVRSLFLYTSCIERNHRTGIPGHQKDGRKVHCLRASQGSRLGC